MHIFLKMCKRYFFILFVLKICTFRFANYITIGYNIPMKSKAVKSLRLSAGISNLATITGYSGLTPMINSYVVSNTLGIDDKRTYPLYRTYSLGLSIQF